MAENKLIVVRRGQRPHGRGLKKPQSALHLPDQTDSQAPTALAADFFDSIVSASRHRAPRQPRSLLRQRLVEDHQQRVRLVLHSFADELAQGDYDAPRVLEDETKRARHRLATLVWDVPRGDNIDDRLTDEG